MMPTAQKKNKHVVLYSFNFIILLLIIALVIGVVAFRNNKVFYKRNDFGIEQQDGSGFRPINRFKKEEVEGTQITLEQSEKQNPDGTYIRVTKLSEDSGVLFLYETFDEFGNKLRERKSPMEDLEAQGTTKTYDLTGDFLKAFKIKSGEGNAILTFVVSKTDVALRVEYYPEKKFITIKLNQESGKENTDNIRIIVADKGLELYRAGTIVLVPYSIEVDTDNGDLILTSSLGKFKLSAYPDIIVKRAKDSGYIDDFNSIVLEEMNKKIVYRIDGFSRQRLIGIFSILVPMVLYYDTETGELIKTQQESASKILDYVSI